jgi:hypothetical protein
MRGTIIATAAALVAALLVTPSGASAETATGFQTGRMLKGLCSSTDVVSQSKCAGYIIGTFDTLQKVMGDQKRCFFAAPKNFDTPQIVGPIIAYLDDHPAELDFIASGLIAKAWIKEFPC